MCWSDHVPVFAHHTEENPLGCSSLMGGDNVPVTKYILDYPVEALEAVAASITFVTNHHRRPLSRAHCCRARVGKEINYDGISWQQKQVVMCLVQKPLSFLSSRPVNRLHRFDLKGFNNCLDGHVFSLEKAIISVPHTAVWITSLDSAFLSRTGSFLHLAKRKEKSIVGDVVD